MMDLETMWRRRAVALAAHCWLVACGEDASSVAPPPAAPPVTEAPRAEPDVATPQRVFEARFVHESPPMALASFEGGWVTASRDGVTQWSLDGAPRTRWVVAPSTPHAVAADAVRIALATSGGIQLWLSGRIAFEKRDPSLDEVHDVALLPDGFVTAHGGESYADGHHVVMPRGPCGICAWSHSGERRWTVPRRGSDDWVTAVAVSPDGTRVASGHSTGHVRIWSARDGALEHEARAVLGRVDAMRYVDDGATVVFGGERGIGAWVPPAAPAPIVEARGVVSIAVRGDWIAWTTLREWGRAHRDGSRRSVHLPRDRGVARAVAFGPDDTIGVLGTERLHRWRDDWLDADVPAGRAEQMRYDGDDLLVFSGPWLHRYGASEHTVRLLHPNLIAADGASGVLAYGHSHDRLVLELDGQPARIVPLDAHGDRLAALRLSDDGKLLAVSAGRRTLVIDVFERRLAREARHDGTVTDLAWSGASLYGLTDDAMLVFGDGAPERVPLPAQPIGLACGASTCAAALTDGSVALWHDASTRVIRANEALTSVALSSDAEQLVCGSQRGTIIVMSRLRAETRRLEAHQRAVTRLALGPRGRLASAGADGLRLWQL